MNKTLVDVCIDMMTKEGSFQTVVTWLKAVQTYWNSFLNATLACDIWDEIKNNKDSNQTLIVVTGNAHTKNLAQLMSGLCEVIVEVPSDRNGKIISVQEMDEYLHGDFSHVPSTLNSCRIL